MKMRFSAASRATKSRSAVISNGCCLSASDERESLMEGKSDTRFCAPHSALACRKFQGTKSEDKENEGIVWLSFQYKAWRARRRTSEIYYHSGDCCDSRLHGDSVCARSLQRLAL